MKGIPGVVSQDQQKATELHKSAAEQGLPEAQNALANIYTQGAPGIVEINNKKQRGILN